MQEKQEMQVQSLGHKIPWRRRWQPTPVFLLGKSHGERSLVGYSPRGRKSLTWLNDWAHTYTHTHTHTHTNTYIFFPHWHNATILSTQFDTESIFFFELSNYHHMSFPGGLDGKESTCNEEMGSIPGSRRSPRKGDGYLSRYFCLENSVDRGAWRATARGVSKSQTRLEWLTLSLFIFQYMELRT